MIELQTLLLFGVASLALTASPGPDMLLIAARSAVQGKMAGVVTYLGVAAGSFTHALALALGLSQLFLAVPFTYDLVRYTGAAYLLYLAWQAFRTANGFATEQSATDRKRTMFVIFRQGYLSNILNPKVALFFLALFPQFIDPSAGSVALQIIIMAIILNIVGFFVNLTVILLAGTVRSFSSRAKCFEKWSRYFLGTVFGGLAAKLVFDGQR